ncbi:unnamed protein product [Lactuca virosa]|uniref:Uncharacterized protein n=1 Tax=Lactuca virosa TaxID=75947 RepID=A0AAU9MA92_9ASTR|nr:unnamed protein product [Lactuca virosa]
MEEGITSNIIQNVSNTDSNVNIHEGISTSALDTSAIPLPPPSSPQPTSMILYTLVPVVSPTFQAVMNEPIGTFFFHLNQQKQRKLLMKKKMKMM